MKKSILIILAILVVCAVQAQLPKLPSKADMTKAQQSVKSETAGVTDQANPGGLISTLTNNISDTAFTDSFKKNKSGFLSSLSNVKDASSAGKALQTLQGGLLPSAMSKGWATIRDKWIKDAGTASTLKSFAGSAGTLESNISDKFFKSSWVKAHPAWEAGLKALSK